MSHLHVLAGFGEGFYRIALAEGASFAQAHELIWALSQSSQTVVERLQVFPGIPVLGAYTATAPLELHFRSQEWELCYCMNTEHNVPEDFEPVRTVAIDDVCRAAWQEPDARMSLREFFEPPQTNGGGRNGL